MFFTKKNLKKIDKIKAKFLGKKDILRSISIYADNKKLDISDTFVLRNYDEIYNNLLSLKMKGINNYLIENFSNVDNVSLLKKYDIVLVKLDFKIITLISENETINKINISYKTPTNVWVLEKGAILFYNLKNKIILSPKIMLIN